MNQDHNPRVADYKTFLAWTRLRESHPGRATEFYHANRAAIVRVLDEHEREKLTSKLEHKIQRVKYREAQLDRADPRDVTTRIRFNQALVAMTRIQRELRDLRLGATPPDDARRT